MDNNKKTIFMSINSGIIARNILVNNFFYKLKEKYNVVIFTPLYNDKEFLRRFGGKGVKFEELKKHNLSKLESIFCAIHKGLIYNPTVKIRTQYGFSVKHSAKRNWKKPFIFYFQHIFFGLFLSKFKFLRDWMKFLDKIVFNHDYYHNVFEKYKPIAIFVTHIQIRDEVYLLRSAKKHKVFCFGMTKSWDNFSQNGFRETVDKFIVWSDFMKEEAISFQNYRTKDIAVIGIPQLDIYHQIRNRYRKEDFTKIYGLDEHKKIILLGQESIFLSPDDPYVVSIIKDWIIKNNKNYQILIRPHFKHKNPAEYFSDLIDNKIVFIDTLNNPSNFSDGWDLSQEHCLRLALSLRFSDVVVTTASTLILDSLASDTNVISYCFDKDKNKPYKDSIKRLFETLWILDLQKHGLKKFMVYSEKELCQRIEEILENPQKEISEEKKSIVSRSCYKIDDQSGSRLFNIINSTIKEL